MLREDSVLWLNFSQDDFSQCHDFCSAAGCSKAFDRAYCTSCGVDSSNSDTGCTDGTPQSSSHLTGGMFINPAYVSFVDTDLECYEPPVIPKTGILGIERKNNSDSDLEKSNDLLIAMSIIVLMMLVFLIVISCSKFKRSKNNKSFAKPRTPTNDKNNAALAKNQSKYIDHDDSTMNPVNF